MKLVKGVIFIFVILLILAKIGWLQPEIAEKVEDVGAKIYDKVANIEYKGQKISDMSVGELATNIGNDVKNIADKVDVEIKGTKVVVNNDRLKMTVDPEAETVLFAEFSREDVETAESVNKVMKSFTGLTYDLIGLSEGQSEIQVLLNRKPNGSFDAIIR